MSELKEALRYNIKHYEELIKFHEAEIENMELKINESSQIVRTSHQYLNNLYKLMEDAESK